MSTSQLLAYGDMSKVPGNFDMECCECGMKQKNRAFCYFCHAVHDWFMLSALGAKAPCMCSLWKDEMQRRGYRLSCKAPWNHCHGTQVCGGDLRFLRGIRLSLSKVYPGARLRVSVPRWTGTGRIEYSVFGVSS